MELVSRERIKYTDTVFGAHLILSCLFISLAFYLFYQLLPLDQMESIMYGAGLGLGIIFVNRVFHAPISWLSQLLFEYIIKPVSLRYNSDNVSVIDICTQVYLLRNNSGWDNLVVVDSWYSVDEKIVFDFIQGNCSNQFSIDAEDLTNDGEGRLFGYSNRKNKSCDSCCHNGEKSSYTVYNIRPASFAMEGYVDECNLCEGCLESIVKAGLDDLDSDVYSKIVSENM